MNISYSLAYTVKVYYQFILKKVGSEEYLFNLDNLNLIVYYLQKRVHIGDYAFDVIMS